MTVRAIIDVPVNTSEFERFQALFNQYKGQLDETPGIWAEVEKEHEGLAKGFKAVTAALLAQNQFAREMEDSQDKQGKQLSTAERIWTGIGKTTKGIAGNIFEATKALAKWTGLLGAVGGLLGAGGLFGIDRMAAGVADTRRRGMGLGLSTGNMTAFEIEMKRLVDPDAFLGNLAEMEGDVTQQGPAYALMGHGLTGDTMKDAVEFLRAERDLAQRTPLGLLGPTFQAYGLKESPDTQRRMHDMSTAEFNSLIEALGKASKETDIKDETAQKWTDFTAKMELAKKSIFKTFVEGLEPLEKPLGRLSDAFKHFLEVFLNSPAIQKAIDDFAVDLDLFAKTLSSPEFIHSVEGFTSDVSGLAKTLHAVMNPRETIEKYGASVASKFIDVTGSGGNIVTLPFKATQDAIRAYQSWSHQAGPSGLLDIIKQLERSGAHAVSPMGAKGTYQLMPGTFKQYADPGDDPFDEFTSRKVAGRYVVDLEEKYGDDIPKVLAAYNWGPGNLDKLLKSHPTDWQQFLPRKETRDYLTRAVPLMQASGQKIRVQVEVKGLPPGHDVTAAAAMLSH